MTKHLLLIPTLLLMALLTGCAGNAGEFGATVAVTSSALHINGVLHGGQQPVSGATVQLYAVGITGLQSSATPLFTTPVVSNANGNFSFAAGWNCTSNTAAYGSNPLIYLVATGGNPGLGQGRNNPAISLMAALGSCSTLSNATYISVNELTTVAAVYALAPFMADYAHVGAQGANASGLINAFQIAGALADYPSGRVPGPNLAATATAPVSELNTLANLIAACINSDGQGSGCQLLFGATVQANGASPTDTIAALLQVARSPAVNVATLYNAIPAASPFQPSLSATPNDWTVALNFSGGGLNAPTGIALDAAGNAWVANAGGNSVTELGPGGALLTGANGYTAGNTLFGAQAIAVDRSGNVWVAATLLSSVVKLTVNGGTVQSAASFSGGGISGPAGIAIDSQNNVWVSNFAGASVTELTSSGSVAGAGPLTASGQLQSPAGIAIDASGNVWVADNAAGNVVEFANNQALLSGSGYSDGAMLAPEGVVLDGAGVAWVTGNGNNGVSLFQANGTPVAGTPATGGGLALPAGIAADGSSRMWISNSVTAGSVSELAATTASPLSPATGFGTLNAASSVAIDASGSVWTANAGDNTVSLFVGAASPRIVPIAATVGP